MKERKTQYVPFRLTISFNRLCLFVTATPLASAYIPPGVNDEDFVTSHTTECRISWTSDSTIAFTGYFPRDIVGTDILTYFYPGDLHILKEAFKEVVKGLGQPCRSPPVRLLIKNGCLITITSIWSSFMNPWKRHLEFLVGRHTVIEGPTNRDVFSTANVYEKEFLKDAFKDCFNTRNEIRAQLQERTDSSDKSKSAQKLSRFMGTLAIEEGSSKDESVYSQIPESTSEPVPTYEQLTNYENLTRCYGCCIKSKSSLLEIHAGSSTACLPAMRRGSNMGQTLLTSLPNRISTTQMTTIQKTQIQLGDPSSLLGPPRCMNQFRATTVHPRLQERT